MTRTSRIVAFAAFGVAALIAWTPSPAWAFKCCDQWGYDYPGTFLTKKGCKNAGGVVESGLSCSNFTFPFKCCDAAGAPIPGVFASPHSCKTSGHEVFSGLQCPQSGPFQCCDPDGGSAPGVYVFRYNCLADGYLVQDFSINGCEGSAWNNAVESVKQVFNAYSCSKDTYADYNKPAETNTTPGPDNIMSGWKRDFNEAKAAWLAANPGGTYPLGAWTDKDDHCIMSCLLTVECGKAAAKLAGWGRETLQMCDNKPFNAWGWGDECANRLGRDYADDQDLDDSGNYAGACRDYCTSIADLDTQCAGPLGNFAAGHPDFKGNMTSVINGFHNLFGKAWDKISNKCISILGGLTFPSAASDLADDIHELKTQGLAMIAAVGNIGADGVGNFVSTGDGTGEADDGALVMSLSADETMVMLNLPESQIDGYLTFKAGALSAMQFRGASGETMLMSLADPITVACSTPPCERRLAWSQWTILPEPSEVIAP